MLNYTSRLGNLISSKPVGRATPKRTGRKSRSLRFETLDPRLLLTVDPIVQFNTSFGSFQVELFADAAPQTVTNFLKYVNAGSYTNTFFHRTVTIASGGIGIVQGGGFSASGAPFPPNPTHIPTTLTSPALPLESSLANSEGTIAMARTSDPNSGTSEFFFNSHDNTTTLPAGANNGYTVFGKVLGNGLTILQQIEATKRLNEYFQIDPNNILGPIPLVNFDPDTATQINGNNLIIVNSVTVVGGSISGKVFIDQDSNGLINGPDAGKAGFAVFIDANDDGVLTAGEVSSVTDANGAFTFNVAVGNYVVRVVPQTGWMQTSPTAAAPALGALRISVAANQNLTDQNFGLAVILSTPNTPILPSAFDSGSSNSDGKTNLKSLQFTVSGVQDGATVTLRDGQNVIGTAVAQGTSVTIVPAADFADGSHSITATQSFLGQTSSTSLIRTVVVKTTAPIISSTAPTTAVVGALYSYNVIVSSDVIALTLQNPVAGMVAPTLAPTPLTWTPAASQIGNHSTTLVATDVFGNSAQQLIQIAVNGPPFFPPIPDQKVNQGAQLSFTPTATDLDALTWSLGNDAPVGAEINSTTGLFTWTPTAAVAAGTYAITVTVTDPGNLTASQVLHVVVNAPPVVAVIDPKSVDEGTTLSFQIPATDQDALTYQLIGTVPAGASVNAAGLFTWHPTKDQVGSDYSFTVRVTDTGGLTADRAFTVTAVKLRGTFGGKVFVDQNDDGQVNGLDSGKAGFTVYIDANDDGQLNDGEESTVTDANGNYSFEGLPGDYVVRIVPQSGWGQTTPSGQDGQRFALQANEIVTDKNFGLTIVLSNPDKPVLPSAFDSGLLNNDGNTNQTSLQFVVTGVQVGATVTLYDNGNQIGSAVAQGNTVTIAPIAAFADGSHSITAKQTLEGNTSNASQTRSVVVKTTPPLITSTPPATAVVGTPYAYNVVASSDTVAFSLLNPVAGMTAPTLSTPLTWTPSAAQVGPQSTTLVATDLFGNTAEQVIEVAVNAPPVFPPIPDQLVNQGSQFSFTPTVTDLDNLTWSLGDGAPDGVAIDQNTGLVTWSPTSATPPGKYSITINVVDSGSLGASQVMHVTVNAPPVLSPIDSKEVDEGKPLSFQIPVTDQDTLAYELLGNPPAGASIDANGLFSWQPTEAQGGVIYDFTVKVTDTGGFTAQQSFKITVNKVDSPPLVAPINQINVTRGNTINLVANGTDADLPFAGITYSLDAGAPAGATIDPDTGAFNWQVPANYPLGKTTITIRVTDKTQSALSATTTVEIVVSPIPTLPGDGGIGVDDDLLEELASNPGIAALLVGQINGVGNLPTLPSGPAVLQQLAKVAVDRAVVGLNESGNELFSGFIDLLGPLDHGLSHDTEQMELERAALNEEVAGDGEQKQGDATKASHVEPIDVKGLNNEKSPPPRQRVRDAGAGAQKSQNQLQQHSQLKINVAPQAKAWPTAQSFKAQLQKTEASKLQAAKTPRTESTQTTASNAAATNRTGSTKATGRDEQSTERSSERNRGKIATAATAAMIPLLIGQLEARDKMAERNRKQQSRRS